MDRRDELWAVCSYFNPMAYARRLITYRAFRRRLPVPLVTVELASDCSKFALRPGDADILIQLVGEDQLWQKERLLNIGLQAVPRACQKVAWLDGDVVFPQASWARWVSQALDRFPLVQAFRTFFELPLDASDDGAHPAAAYGHGYGLAYHLANGTTPADLLRRQEGTRIERQSSPGFAWAARRELLDRHGLYDGCILGGGDKVIAVAAIGLPDAAILSQDMTVQQQAHYTAWAQPFFDDVRGDIGYVDADLCHLWHGDLRSRRHRQRYTEFQRFNFDPYVDIALDAHGCWRWNTHKLQMHEYLRRHFAGRNEDAVSALTPMPAVPRRPVTYVKESGR